MVARLNRVSGLQRAYLVRKRLTQHPNLPLYVLGFSATALGFTSNARTREVMERLRTLEFPGETLIINIGGANPRFARKFRGLSGARIV